MSNEKEKGFLTVSIAICVVRKDGKYCSTNERKGWYLPAGRVDYGESIINGAKRETQEEAGIPVNLNGIFRVEISPHSRYFRVRVVFAATPIDNTPLKSIPDQDTYGAEWLTIKDVENLLVRNLLRGEKEILNLFNWVEKGTTVFPIELLTTCDSDHINHKEVFCYLVHSVKLVIFDTNNLNILVSNSNKENEKYSLPYRIMSEEAISHQQLAQEVLPCEAYPISLQGIVCIQHKPPFLKNDEDGYFCVVYYANLTRQIELQGYHWLDFKMLDINLFNKNDKYAIERSSIILKDRKYLAPLNFIACEGDRYISL